MNPESGQLRVPASELDYAGDLFYTYKGEAFTGVAYEEVPGKWLSEVSYRDGLQEGVGRDWYPSGALKSESWYRENALHGFSREYNEDQVKVLEEVYEYGILVCRTRWDDVARDRDMDDRSGRAKLRPASAIQGAEAVARGHLMDRPARLLGSVPPATLGEMIRS